jgi:HUS1 checkpoint protein
LKVPVNGYLKFQDLDIQVSFMVFPAEPSSSAASSSTRRLQLALQKEEASAVSVSMKHFAKSLQCYLTKPDASFCGVAPDDACLLMLFQYFKPGTRQTDNTISLHYRLPVLDQGRP